MSVGAKKTMFSCRIMERLKDAVRVLMKENGFGLRLTSMIFLWIYDTIKLIIGYKTMVTYNINPWIFAFIDFTTVPPYINGWARMFSILRGKPEPLPVVLKWTAITLFASTAPYIYAVWAGRQELPVYGWVVILVLVFFPIVNQVVKIIGN